MTIDSNQEDAVMLDRSHAEALISCAALAAFTYYPEKHLDEPGYTIEEDLDWCAEQMAVLPQGTQDELLIEIRMLMTDPTRDRQPFIRTVRSLTDVPSSL